MTNMLIEVYKTQGEAEDRAQYWLAREGYTVEKIELRTVQWNNNCSPEKSEDFVSGVWAVLARR